MSQADDRAEIVQRGDRFVPMRIAIGLYRAKRGNPALTEQSLRRLLREPDPPIASIMVGGRYFVSVASIEAYTPGKPGRKSET